MTTTHTDDELDGLDGYVPPPYVPPATLDERLAKAWREITSTPARTALAVLDLCAVVGFLAYLRPIPVTTSDAAGPLRARCGISFYVTGASNHAVDTACRYAFGSRVPELLGFALLAALVTALLLHSIVRPVADDHDGRLRTLWREVTRTPARAALVTFDLAALVALYAAVQPVTIATADATGPLRARCGLQYLVFGAANSAVGHACRRSYAPHAWAFVLVLTSLLGGIVALVAIVRQPGRPREQSSG